MNTNPPIHMAYNQQTNNQYNDHRSLHASRTSIIFNGPIHGFIERVTGEGPVIAYSQVTYVDRGPKKPIFLGRTTVASERKASSVRTTPPSRLPIEKASEDNRHNEAVPGGEALTSPSVPLSIYHNDLAPEFQKVSPEMQRYIKHLLSRYENSVTEAKKNGQVCEDDQR